MTEAISQQLKDLNDKRQYAGALKLYELRNQNSEEELDAHLHYQAVLAQLMLGAPTANIDVRLKQCANYTAEMRGDLSRDVALSLIRQGNDLDRAKMLINEAINSHRLLPLRLAVDNQALGRLLEARGDIAGAYTVLYDAVSRLQRHRPGDSGWLSNTAFHLLRLSLKNGHRAKAHRAMSIVVRNDPSWKKRWAARAMYYLPTRLSIPLVARFR